MSKPGTPRGGSRRGEHGQVINSRRAYPERLQAPGAIERALDGLGVPPTPPKRHGSRITEQQEEIFWTVWNATNNASEAQRRAGISDSTGKRLIQKFKAGQRRLITTPPDPVPYKKLGYGARKAMDMEHPMEAFRYWHENYVGLEWEPWMSFLAEEVLLAYLSPDDEFLVVNVGPGFGKSTTLFSAEVWIAMWERCRGEWFTGLLGHLAESIAETYVGRVAKFVTTRQRLIADFGRVRPIQRGPGIPWSNHAVLFEPLEWDVDALEKEATFTAWGSGSSFQGGRYKWCRWDDLLDLENQSTEGQRQKMRTFWTMKAEPRMNDGGTTILSNVRVHPLDLSHTLLATKRKDDEGNAIANEYRRVVVKAHYPEKCTKGEDGKPVHTGPWPAGCITSPKRGSWKRQRHAMDADPSGRTYKLMYQQEDVGGEGRMEAVYLDGGMDSKGVMCPGCWDDDRSFWQLPDRPDAMDPVFASVIVDPSDVNKWCFQYVLYYPDGTFVVLAAVHKPFTGPEVIYRGLDGNFSGLLEVWFQKGVELGVPYNLLVVEAVWGSRSLSQWPFFQDWLRARRITMEGHETGAEKGSIFTGVDNLVSAILRQGRWRVPRKGAEEILFAESMNDEVVGFPEAATDDIMMDTWFLLHRFEYYRELALAKKNLHAVTHAPAPGWTQEVAAGATDTAPGWAHELLDSRGEFSEEVTVG